ncbi:hypothetical protein ABXV22_25350 [Vibrio rotiferianus]|uniref:hypothetical protein n=1 Tax=Vibrio rotiferianus TaxID=190895 RepID=UPI00339869CF
MSSDVVRFLKVNIAGVSFDIPLYPCPEHDNKYDQLRHLLATADIDKVFNVVQESGIELESVEEAPITREVLVEKLQSMGFEIHVPRTSSWMYALAKSNSEETIYFLLGKRNVSFKYYEQVRDTRLDDTGKLYTEGGTLVRCYYEKSGIDIHNHILALANKFSSGGKLSSDDLKDYGVSQKEQNERSRLLQKAMLSLEQDF